ncbi:hypothetical protein [Leptospira alexanderi]|uniref:Uncharacterized protein n=1 Tax=Leptospira alexanderi serovar Manhao 3 str. L 60 TaxID=1049759 RepID=V6I3V1_9LEPT|nr:hypothetical protein [Leptospira alexanderi]EQA64696.1 hypothetical protein LEP1GSC062_3986 [Leptospira alexanderi serovar Manhao 3 str. L 60]
MEYNVSRPYKKGILHRWDNTIPKNCNFGISLSVFEENSKFLDSELRYGELVVSVAQTIFNEFQTPVYYRRIWLQSGKNVKREMIFDFKASCKDRIEIHSEILSIILYGKNF